MLNNTDVVISDPTRIIPHSRTLMDPIASQTTFKIYRLFCFQSVIINNATREFTSLELTASCILTSLATIIPNDRSWYHGNQENLQTT